MKIPFCTGYDPVERMLTLRGATCIPDELFDFPEPVEILDLSQGALTTIPRELLRLRELKIIFVSRNPIERLPEVLGEFPRLRMIGCKGCQIQEVPAESLPESLEWLVLSENRLESIPAGVGKLKLLKKFALAGNRIQTIPEELGECQQLELIRLGANNLEKPAPTWMFELPRLAWYGDSGNPFSTRANSGGRAPVISHDDLSMGEIIGRSPTSTVYSAQLRSGEPVAVKIYQSEMTSDGYAIDDLRAFLGCGSHPNLIPVRGELQGHPEGKRGLVLKLIPAEYSSLGLPPSLATCTRDRFNEGVSISPEFLINAAHDIAAAMKHLLERGIMHGDLYAHNILSNASGRSILGDFGAASFFTPEEREIREQVEVRAFGYLLDDLLGILGEGAVPTVEKLRDQCLALVPCNRPSFAEVASLMEGALPASP